LKYFANLRLSPTKRRLFMLLLLVGVVVSATEVVPVYAKPLSVAITPTSATVQRGSNVTFTVTEQGADLVHLTASISPILSSGPTFGLTRMTIDQFNSALLIVHTSKSTTTGTYTFTVKASCLEPFKCRLQGETATANATLTVT
jgi:hypothetical protein